MSKVGNLRAMFEQKGDSSPPFDRGRSPGIVLPELDSPRPLSKVRTSFVAVEKDGRIGLQRNTSRDPSISSSARKYSDETDVTTPPVNERSDDPPQQKTLDSGSPVQLVGSHTDADISSPIKHGKNSVGENQGHVSGPKNQEQAEANVDHLMNKTKNGTKQPGEGVNRTKAKVARPTLKPAAPISAATSTKPVKAALLNPAAATLNLVSKSHEPSSKGSHAVKLWTPQVAKTATSLFSAKKQTPPPLHASPISSGVGFVKPKAKSPTRPVRLPPGLTSHTAASGSKVRGTEACLTHFRESGIIHAEQASSQASAASAGTAGLGRQKSAIHRSRPALGPPPKDAVKDHPPTRKESKVSQDFLARMMRPTQSSSSKTAGEKAVPNTPPRKTAAPARKQAVSQHQAAEAKPVKNGGFLVLPHKEASPAATKTQAIDGAQPATPEEANAVAKEVRSHVELSGEAAQLIAAAAIAPTAEQAETTEELLADAKEAQGKEVCPPHVGQPSAAQVVAPAVEQTTVAEQTAEVVKDIEGETKLPENVVTEKVDVLLEQATPADVTIVGDETQEPALDKQVSNSPSAVGEPAPTTEAAAKPDA